MLRKLITPCLFVLAMVGCRAHARVGPVHAGGGISSTAAPTPAHDVATAQR
jgi:hypothetical protein